MHRIGLLQTDCTQSLCLQDPPSLYRAVVLKQPRKNQRDGPCFRSPIQLKNKHTHALTSSLSPDSGRVLAANVFHQVQSDKEPRHQSQLHSNPVRVHVSGPLGRGGAGRGKRGQQECLPRRLAPDPLLCRYCISIKSRYDRFFFLARTPTPGRGDELLHFPVAPARACCWPSPQKRGEEWQEPRSSSGSSEGPRRCQGR